MTGAAPPHTTAGLGALITAAACWGSVVVTVKIASRGLPVLTITMLEVLVGLAVLGVVLVVRDAPLGRPDRLQVMGGILEPGLAYPLINAGLNRTSGTHAAIIIGLESLAVVAGRALLDRERPSGTVSIAVAVTAVGAIVVAAGRGGTATTAGDALVAAGVVTAAGYVLLAQRQPNASDAVAATFYQFLFGAIALTAIDLVITACSGSVKVWGHPTNGQVAAALGAGLVGSAIAFGLYNWALTKVTTALAGTSLTLIPVFGIGFSVAFLGDAINLRIIAGVIVVVAGIALASSPFAERRRDRRSVRAAPTPTGDNLPT